MTKDTQTLDAFDDAGNAITNAERSLDDARDNYRRAYAALRAAETTHATALHTRGEAYNRLTRENIRDRVEEAYNKRLNENVRDRVEEAQGLRGKQPALERSQQ